MQEGDIVKLKSGGPKMTIREIRETRAFCDWFLNDTQQNGNFPLESLEKA